MNQQATQTQALAGTGQVEMHLGLRVRINLDGTDPHWIGANMRSAVNRLFAEGMITGNTEATVEGDHRIDLYQLSQPEADLTEEEVTAFFQREFDKEVLAIDELIPRLVSLALKPQAEVRRDLAALIAADKRFL
ncbi:hypothetical protein [Paraburkholderia youngii]|uniref:hypothetical protein n=1 Tax=Paraburkholderia youngii TaxID=2782701 RepID=UPI003D204A29